MAYCISSPWFYHVQDPGALKCRGRNDEFRKRRPMVDDHVLDIVKRAGLEGLYRTPSREIDHNLITAFVEQWWPKTHTFHLPHGETTITLRDVVVCTISSTPTSTHGSKVMYNSKSATFSHFCILLNINFTCLPSVITICL